MKTRGIILAGGSGTRLYPITRSVSKQLLPVYDKPMIYYPLTTLMLAGIRELLIITTPRDRAAFRRTARHGRGVGSRDFVRRATQSRTVSPKRSSSAATSSTGRRSALVLGDNLFYGHDLAKSVQTAASKRRRARRCLRIASRIPQAYGVVEFDANGRAVSIEEKPSAPKSNFAVTGLYFYDEDVTEIAAGSSRLRAENSRSRIVNRVYLERGKLRVEVMGRGSAWLDTGTHDSLLQASHFVQTVEQRQGLKISAPEEVAYRMGYIDRAQLRRLATQLGKSEYGTYLRALADEDVTRMKVEPTELPGVVVVHSPVYGDARGFFTEVFHEERFRALGLPTHFAQDSHSRSSRRTCFVASTSNWRILRESSCARRAASFSTSPSIFVDRRRTIGKWVGVTLEAGDGRQLWIPPGFAHGFLVLSDVG